MEADRLRFDLYRPFLLGLTSPKTTTTSEEGEEEREVNIEASPPVEPSPASPMEVDLHPKSAEDTPPAPSSSFAPEEGTPSSHQLSESWIQPDSSSSSSASSLRRHPQEDTSASTRSSFDGMEMEMEGSWVAGLGEQEKRDSEKRGRRREGDGSSTSDSSSILLDSSFISTTNTKGASSCQDTAMTESSFTSPSTSTRSRSRSSSPSSLVHPQTTELNNDEPEPSSSLLFPSPSQSFAHLPPLPSSPSPDSPPLTYHSSSTTAAAAAPIEWGCFEGGKAEELAVHKDEGQIRLDTRRGFVVWPEGEFSRRFGLPARRDSGRREAHPFPFSPRPSPSRLVNHKNRLKLQSSLHALIVTVMRRHPPFRYFQVSS